MIILTQEQIGKFFRLPYWYRQFGVRAYPDLITDSESNVIDIVPERNELSINSQQFVALIFHDTFSFGANDIEFKFGIASKQMIMAELILIIYRYYQTAVGRVLVIHIDNWNRKPDGWLGILMYGYIYQYAGVEIIEENSWTLPIRSDARLERDSFPNSESSLVISQGMCNRDGQLFRYFSCSGIEIWYGCRPGGAIIIYLQIQGKRKIYIDYDEDIAMTVDLVKNFSDYVVFKDSNVPVNKKPFDLSLTNSLLSRIIDHSEEMYRALCFHLFLKMTQIMFESLIHVSFKGDNRVLPYIHHEWYDNRRGQLDFENINVECLPVRDCPNIPSGAIKCCIFQNEHILIKSYTSHEE